LLESWLRLEDTISDSAGGRVKRGKGISIVRYVDGKLLKLPKGEKKRLSDGQKRLHRIDRERRKGGGGEGKGGLLLAAVETHCKISRRKKRIRP